MIQSLANYYKSLLESKEVYPCGWTTAKISFFLELNEDGTVIGLGDFGEKKVYCVPEQVTRNQNPSPYFLCDASEYIFGLKAKGTEVVPSREKFEASADLHLRLLEHIRTPASSAICNFYKKWDVANAINNEIFNGVNLKKVLTGKIIFYYDGRPVTKDACIETAWNDEYAAIEEKGETETLLRDVITGELVVPIDKHLPVSGIGAQPITFISFDKPSFQSYGMDKNKNAVMGRETANAYVAALNYLLNHKKDHSVFVDGVTIVFWADKNDKAASTLFRNAIGYINADIENDEDDIESETEALNEAVKEAVSLLSKGYQTKWSSESISPDCHFFIIGLIPNGRRASVSFFYEDCLGDIMKNIDNYYSQLEIYMANSSKLKKKPLTPKRVARIISPPASKKKESGLVIMQRDIFYAAISGANFPTAMLQRAVERFSKEKTCKYNEAAILKAYLLRNKFEKCPKEVLTVALNKDCTNIPYLLGRDFAIIEKLQADARESSTIHDRFFSAASQTPASVFAEIHRKAEIYISKFKDSKGSAIYYSKMINEIVSKIDEVPATLDAAEQAAFMLGYYHQTEDLYTPKDK